MPTQKGLYLRAATHTVSEIPVPTVKDTNAIQPNTYASILKVSAVLWAGLRDMKVPDLTAV